VPLTILNSTRRDIEEVRVHDEMLYAAAPNLLAQVLPDDGTVDVQFLAGQRVTVIRRNVAAGRRIAFTTAHGLDVHTPGWVLRVLQESFQLLAPDLSESGDTDGAPGDGEPLPGDDGGGDP